MEVLLVSGMFRQWNLKIINIASFFQKRKLLLPSNYFLKAGTKYLVITGTDDWVTWQIICSCKYLFLLYDDSFLRNQNYIFTTEGHPLPIRSTWHEIIPTTHVPSNWTFVKVISQFLFPVPPYLHEQWYQKLIFRMTANPSVWAHCRLKFVQKRFSGKALAPRGRVHAMYQTCYLPTDAGPMMTVEWRPYHAGEELAVWLATAACGWGFISFFFFCGDYTVSHSLKHKKVNVTGRPRPVTSVH